jgi:hypothetical protein
MLDSSNALVDWLRAEFVAEQNADFARLRRIPDTHVIRFVDVFTALPPTEQADVTDLLAHWSSYTFLGQQIPPPLVERFERFSQLTRRKGFAEGLRYTGVNLLAGLARSHTARGGLSGWLQSQGVTGLAARPPELLASGIEDLTPVKIPTLRRMVQRAFRMRFATDTQDLGSEMWRYSGKFEETAIVVEIRYSGRMGRPQLDYSVTVQPPNVGWTLHRITFESIFGVGSGWWDYLTAENAERSVALLCDLIEYTARLPERLYHFRW